MKAILSASILFGLILAYLVSTAFAVTTCTIDSLSRGPNYLKNLVFEGKLPKEDLQECLMLSRDAKKTDEKKIDKEENSWLVKAAPGKTNTIITELKLKNPSKIKEVARNWVYVKNVNIDEIKKINYVEKIEPNYKYSSFTPNVNKGRKPRPTPTINPSPTPTLTPVSGLPNDPYYNQQWNLPWIQSQDAWKSVKNTSNITVAVIDTGCGGVNPHPDLNVYAGYNTINNTNNYNDDNGHGTHVAGIIAATSNNGTGISGISWQSKLLCVKGLDSSGSGYVSDLAEAVTWAKISGAKVINASWGGTEYTQALADSIADFQTSGGIFVAARGNSHDNEISYPAMFPGVISVGATDKNDKLATFSSFGNTTIVAPGVDIYSLYMDGVSSPTYKTLSGTSMATPHVAGAALLVWAKNPNLTSQEVVNILKLTSDDLGKEGYDAYFGYGRLNLGRALSYAAFPVIGKTDVMQQTFSTAGGKATLKYKITNATSASISINGTNVNIDPGQNETILDIPANSDVNDKIINLTLIASNINGNRTIKLPTIKVVSRQNSQKLVYKEELKGYLQQSDDVASAKRIDGTTLVANSDYYLSGINIHYQLENGVWGPEIYRYTHIPGGASNGTVALELKDINQDNVPDLIGFSRFNGIFVWKGVNPVPQSGDIFSASPDIQFAANPDDGVVADLNNDSKNDILWVNQNAVNYVLNIDGNSFGPVQSIKTVETMFPEKVDAVNLNGAVKIAVYDGYYQKVKLFTLNEGKVADISSCGFDDFGVSLIDSTSFGISVPCSWSTGYDYFTFQSDNTYTFTHVYGDNQGSWRHNREIKIGSERYMIVTDPAQHDLLQIQFSTQTIQRFPSDTLAGHLEKADINNDGLDDIIHGFDGYVYPYGAHITIWQQNP